MYKLALLCVLLGLFQPLPGMGDEFTRYPSLGFEDIQGMDIYADRNDLHLVLVGKGEPKGKPVIAYFASRDGGANWTRPVQVSRGQDGRIFSRRGDEAQISVAGSRIVIAFRHGDEATDSGPLAVAYSRDGGKKWTRGGVPAPGDQTRNQSYPELLADRQGNFHLVWLDDREENGNTQGLRYAKSVDGGRHWRGDSTLDPAVCTCCWNRLAELPDRSIAALYRGDDPHDMRLARVSPDGGSWKGMGAVGDFGWRFSGCPHCGGGIAVSPDHKGLLHAVVWSGKEGVAGLYYLKSADQGAHWSQPLKVAEGRSRESDIAALPNGQVGLVYVSPQGDSEGVRFTRSSDDGKTWTSPSLLSNSGVVPDHPRLLSTPEGFRAFWTEKKAEGGKVLAMYSLENKKN